MAIAFAGARGDRWMAGRCADAYAGLWDRRHRAQGSHHDRLAEAPAQNSSPYPWHCVDRSSPSPRHHRRRGCRQKSSLNAADPCLRYWYTKGRERSRRALSIVPATPRLRGKHESIFAKVELFGTSSAVGPRRRRSISPMAATLIRSTRLIGRRRRRLPPCSWRDQ